MPYTNHIALCIYIYKFKHSSQRSKTKQFNITKIENLIKNLRKYTQLAPIDSQHLVFLQYQLRAMHFLNPPDILTFKQRGVIYPTCLSYFNYTQLTADSIVTYCYIIIYFYYYFIYFAYSREALLQTRVTILIFPWLYTSAKFIPTGDCYILIINASTYIIIRMRKFSLQFCRTCIFLKKFQPNSRFFELKIHWSTTLFIAFSFVSRGKKNKPNNAVFYIPLLPRRCNKGALFPSSHRLLYTYTTAPRCLLLRHAIFICHGRNWQEEI